VLAVSLLSSPAWAMFESNKTLAGSASIPCKIRIKRRWPRCRARRSKPISVRMTGGPVMWSRSSQRVFTLLRHQNRADT
jgi:hypothetical protein